MTAHCPNTIKFDIWKRFRTAILPFLLGTAIFSIILSGAVVAENASGQPAADSFKTRAVEIVLVNLIAASLLAVLHGSYLALMSYHLIYRFPVEERKSVLRGVMIFAYVALVCAYLLHAIHVVWEALGLDLPLVGAALSPAAFAVSYGTMAAYGLHESRQHSTERPIAQFRKNWMLATDGTITAMALALCANALSPLRWCSWIAGRAEDLVLRAPVIRPFFVALWLQLSAKDFLIITALFIYSAGIVWSRRKFAKVQYPYLRPYQRIDDNATDWPAIRRALPQLKSAWLDLGSGDGSELRELVDRLYTRNDPLFPARIIFLDQERKWTERACADSVVAKPGQAPWLPAASMAEGVPCSFYSAEARKAVAECNVIHISHVAYHPEIVRAVVALTEHARHPAWLVIRYTARASVYRVASASLSCKLHRPYIHHAMHPLLLEDLKSLGWRSIHSTIIARWVDVAPDEAQKELTEWIDARYGEVSGDVMERYMDGFAQAAKDSAGFAAIGGAKLMNADRLEVMIRTGSESKTTDGAPVELRKLSAADEAAIRAWPAYAGSLAVFDYAYGAHGWLGEHPEAEGNHRFAAWSGGSLVGIALLIGGRPGEAEFYIAVRSDLLGKGYGRSITKQVLAAGFADFGLDRISLRVRTWHHQAIHLYESLGFVRTGEADYLFDGKTDRFVDMEIRRPAVR